MGFVSDTISSVFGGGKKPSAPNPAATAAAQQQYNREAIRDAALFSQIGQQTPFGSIEYTGELGSPERTMVTRLDPMDQQALDDYRSIRSGLINLILSGSSAPMALRAPTAQPRLPASVQTPVEQGGGAGGMLSPPEVTMRPTRTTPEPEDYRIVYTKGGGMVRVPVPGGRYTQDHFRRLKGY